MSEVAQARGWQAEHVTQDHLLQRGMVDSPAAATELSTVDHEIIVVGEGKVWGCKEVGHVGGGGRGREGVMGGGQSRHVFLERG